MYKSKLKPDKDVLLTTQSLCCVSVCSTLSMEKKERRAKNCQSQGYKSTSIDLPLSIVHNIIKKFKTHGTVANLPGHGRKRKELMKGYNGVSLSKYLQSNAVEV